MYVDKHIQYYYLTPVDINLLKLLPMLKTTTSRLYPLRPVVPYTTSNPVKSSSTLLHALISRWQRGQ